MPDNTIDRLLGPPQPGSLQYAISRWLLAKMNVASTLWLIFGEDIADDVPNVLDWVQYEPHDAEVSLEVCAERLIAFDHALLGNLTWESPGGRW